MDFDNERALRLIALYRRQRELWDPKHPLYYSKACKAAGWTAVAAAAGAPVDEVRRKMESLLGSFRRERARTRRGAAAGAAGAGRGGRQKYTSTWFAYDKMKFLVTRENPKRPKRLRLESEDVLENGVEVDIEDVTDMANGELEESILDGIHSTFGDALLDVQALEGAETLSEMMEGKPSALVMPQAVCRAPPMPPPEQEVPPPMGSFYAPYADEAAVFGQHVANKLRRYSPRARAVVEHRICDLLFEADMGEHDAPPRAEVLQERSVELPAATRRGTSGATCRRRPCARTGRGRTSTRRQASRRPAPSRPQLPPPPDRSPSCGDGKDDEENAIPPVKTEFDVDVYVDDPVE